MVPHRTPRPATARCRRDGSAGDGRVHGAGGSVGLKAERDAMDTPPKGPRDQSGRVTLRDVRGDRAGQEVARWFFRVGAAVGHHCHDHVGLRRDGQRCDLRADGAVREPPAAGQDAASRIRPPAWNGWRPRAASASNFFVFADTVTARSFTRREETHGWMGIRFQTAPRRRRRRSSSTSACWTARTCRSRKRWASSAST